MSTTSTPPPQEIVVKGKAARIRGATWTHDQVVKLFDVWTQPDIYQGLLNEKKKQDIFKNMAVILESMGVHRTWRECRAKIKNLKADFRKAMDKNTPFRYYEQMKKIMNLDGSGMAPMTAATSSYSGSRTPTIDTYFKPSSSQEQSRSSYQSHESEEVMGADDDDDDEVDSGGHDNEQSFRRSSVIQSSYDPQYQSSSPPYYEHPVTPTTSSRITPPPSTSSSAGPSFFTSTPERPSSRSSMIITHVVSKVIEPVTQIVMPSASSQSRSASAPPEDLETTQPIVLEDESEIQKMDPRTPPPIRLEFVLEDENVVLQTPRSRSPSPIHDEEEIPPRTSPETVEIPPLSPPPPPETATTSPIVTPSTSFKSRQTKRLPPQKARTRPSQQTTKPHPRRKVPPAAPPSTKSAPDVIIKKRKLLETLNKKTIDTISDLLAETSQTLLHEFQEAEQRFIAWEEEKRSQERRREETMFAKLIAAIKPSQQQSSSSTSPPPPPEEGENASVEKNRLSENFSTMSKRINEMVCVEVKQTEESVRQWELKMQRQESRHTEKLFAMIINAIKTSSSHSTGDISDD